MTTEQEKTLRRIAIYMLTAGACIYLGLLSLGGMFALYPILSLAVFSLILSVAYEGEIYKQNIANAFKKLFKPNVLDKNVAKIYLKNLFDAHPDMFKSKEYLQSCPEFFRDYLTLLVKAHHSKSAAKQLKDLESWFYETVFSNDSQSPSSPYQEELLTWLNQQENEQLRPQAWVKNRNTQRSLNRYIAIPLSILASTFAMIGTTFLLFETVSIVPALLIIPMNAWLVMVVPLAIISGVAYGFLTYNTTSDFLLSNPFKKWFNKINNMWQKEPVNAVFVGLGFAALCLLAIGLTICTAGTWRTIALENKSFYGFINSFPKWIMGVINPIISSLSSIIFNLQNTSDSFSLIKKLFSSPYSKIKQAVSALWNSIAKTWQTESWLQFINPFRLHKMVYELARYVFFAGHLVSIGVTSDRPPKISKELSALLGILAELGEDVHYFFGHACTSHSIDELLEERLEGDGHQHNLDLPSLALKTILWPFDILSRGWDKLAKTIVQPPAQAVSSEEDDCHDHCHHDHEHTEPTKNGWSEQNPAWFIDHYHRKHKTNMTPGADRALQEFAQSIKNAKAEKITINEPIPEDLKELPTAFVEKFNMRFG